MSKHFDFYNEEIAPLLKEAIDKCESSGYAFIVAIKNNEICGAVTTLYNDDIFTSTRKQKIISALDHLRVVDHLPSSQNNEDEQYILLFGEKDE